MLFRYDIGALPERTTRSTTSTTTKSSTIVAAKNSKGGRDHKQRPRLSPRRGHLQVGADVLARIKKPVKSHRFSTTRSSNSRQQQQSTAVRDNIAVESTQKSQMRLDHRGHGGQKKPQRSSPPMMQRKVDRILPGLENVERLIPGSLKTVIEDSGKRIVKAVMQPINDFNQPRDTVIRETTFSSAMGNMFGKYRTYFGYMAPTFAPDHITSYLVAQWTSTFVSIYILY